MNLYHFAIAGSKAVYEEWLGRSAFCRKKRPEYLSCMDKVRGIRGDTIVFHLLDGWENSPIFSKDSDQQFYFALRELGASVHVDAIGAERSGLRLRYSREPDSPVFSYLEETSDFTAEDYEKIKTRMENKANE